MDPTLANKTKASTLMILTFAFICVRTDGTAYEQVCYNFWEIRPLHNCSVTSLNHNLLSIQVHLMSPNEATEICCSFIG